MPRVLSPRASESTSYAMQLTIFVEHLHAGNSGYIFRLLHIYTLTSGSMEPSINMTPLKLCAVPLRFISVAFSVLVIFSALADFLKEVEHIGTF